jgi:hypothetical protein
MKTYVRGVEGAKSEWITILLTPPVLRVCLLRRVHFCPSLVSAAGGGTNCVRLLQLSLFVDECKTGRITVTLACGTTSNCVSIPAAFSMDISWSRFGIHSDGNSFCCFYTVISHRYIQTNMMPKRQPITSHSKLLLLLLLLLLLHLLFCAIAVVSSSN